MNARALPSPAVIQALAVTAELTGTLLSPGAAKVLAGDIAHYPERMVLGALDRCRRELKGKLTVSDIVNRLDDGRPGPEEAWATCPRDEALTVVMTDEMAAAWGIANPLIQEGDTVQARMAFLEHYRQAVQRARDEGAPVRWFASIGHDPAGRDGPLREAVAKGRLTARHVAGLLPHIEPIAEPVAKLLQRRDGQ